MHARLLLIVYACELYQYCCTIKYWRLLLIALGSNATSTLHGLILRLCMWSIHVGSSIPPITRAVVLKKLPSKTIGDSSHKAELSDFYLLIIIKSTQKMKDYNTFREREKEKFGQMGELGLDICVCVITAWRPCWVRFEVIVQGPQV